MGSRFTLTLPLRHHRRAAERLELGGIVPARIVATSIHGSDARSPRQERTLEDDRADVQTGDRVLLMVEDDETFARMLLELARERGFRGVVATTGAEAMELARSLEPELITLDLRLPDMNGWVLLDRFEHAAETRHVPIFVISAYGDDRLGRERGALGVLEKPADPETLGRTLDGLRRFLDREERRVLVVEPDPQHRRQLDGLLGADGAQPIEAVAVSDTAQALEALAARPFDCVVLGSSQGRLATSEMLARLERSPAASQGLPILVYAAGDGFTREECERLSGARRNIVVRAVDSPELLLHQASRALRRPESDLPESQVAMLRRLAESDPVLRGRKVLVVDDDVRNIFALTAMLERHQMEVLFAENGHEALAKLAEYSDVEAVLMDIMMPEMDGYEATRQIREDPRHLDLPVIALTAKAMRGDREKCLQAGASDYIVKPVDPDQLLSMLRVWLPR